MKKRSPQLLFADRLPPMIGGMEMHADAFIRHFQRHKTYPLMGIVKSTTEEITPQEEPKILFFNSGRWIEKMESIRHQFPRAVIIYRTGGNEIIQAPLDRICKSHKQRQEIWSAIINQTVDMMITNSAFTEKRLRDTGIQVPFYRGVGGVNPCDTLKKRERSSQPITFFCAARFVPYKNHDLLIEAFNQLHRQGEDFILYLAGDGPLLNQAQQSAAKNPKITFLGRCENRTILEQMDAADVYIQLSSDYVSQVPGGSYVHTEGMGRSILEAISLGTHVIAGKCGALEEIVTADRGELIDLDSIDAIVEKLENVISSPPEKRPSTDTYLWKHLFEKYESLYESLDHH